MSKIYHGSNQVTRMYVGTQEIFKLYEGSTLRWEKPAGTPPPVVLDATIRSTTLAPQPNGTNATRTINKPAGTAEGDMLVLYVSGDSGTASTYTLPTGWTQMFRATATAPKYMGAYKIAGPSEPASYTFGMQGDADGYAVMHAVMNVSTAVQPSFLGTTTASSKTVHTAPSITPSSNRGLLIAHASMHGGSSSATFAWTPPANMTEESDVRQQGWISLTTASQRWDSSASTGTRAFGVTTGVTARAGYASSIFVPSI